MPLSNIYRDVLRISNGGCRRFCGFCCVPDPHVDEDTNLTTCCETNVVDHIIGLIQARQLDYLINFHEDITSLVEAVKYDKKRREHKKLYVLTEHDQELIDAYEIARLTGLNYWWVCRECTRGRWGARKLHGMWRVRRSVITSALLRSKKWWPYEDVPEGTEFRRQMNRLFERDESLDECEKDETEI